MIKQSIATLGLFAGLMGAFTPSSAAAQEAPAPGEASQDLDEVVVTAQRREQSAQDVPISIAAIGGESLAAAGITNTENLAAAFPGLQIQRITGGASPFLRGVGSTSTGLGTSRAVALYIDDIYVNAAAANVFNLSNISSIEVAKGPQGTLFGRNATGGVMQVRTKNPGSDPGVDVEAGYGNYDTVSGSFYADARLNDVLAVNLAVSGRDQRHGYGRNLTTNDDIYLGGFYTVRAKALLNFGDTSLLLGADYYEDDEDFGLNKQALPGNVLTGGAVYPGKYKTTLTTPDTKTNKNWGFSGNLTHDLGDASLIFITGFRRSDLFFTLDQESSAPRLVQAELTGLTDSFSEELRFQSNGEGPFTWLVGAFYYWERASYEPLKIGGAQFAAAPFNGFQAQFSRQSLNSYSAFADATYEIGSATRVTAGLRYTEDRYSEITKTLNANGAVVQGELRQKLSAGKVTWRLVLDHRLSDEVLAYASYSRGFRSGGFVLTAARLPGLEPEVIDAFEAGLKSDLFDRRLRLNVAGYYYDYRDLQVSIIQSGLVGSINAGAAEIYGADIDLRWKVADGLNLNAAANYLHSEYTSFANGPLFIAHPATCGPPPSQLPGPRTGGNRQCAADLAGNRTPHAPKFTANLGVTYEFDTPVGEFMLAGTYYYNDGFFFDSDNRNFQKSYNVLNASIKWTSPSNKFDVKIWGNSLLDEYYYGYISHGGLGTSGSPAAPMSYGVTLGAHF